MRPFNIWRRPLSRSDRSKSADRYQRAALTSISSAIARLVLAAGTLIVVPFALDYLGAERYGVWLTISSFVGLVAFSDLGLGSGLLTAISRAEGQNDRAATRSYVSSGFFMLCAAAFLLALVFAAVWLIVDWGGLLGLSSLSAAAEADVAIGVLAVMLVGSIPLRLTEKVQWAIQEGYIAGVWQSVGALIGIVGILMTIWLGGDLRFFSFALLGGPAAAAVANWVITFRRRQRWMRPRLKYASGRSIRELLRLGAMFLGLQVVVAVAFGVDNLVVARVLGPEQVPQLAVPFQMFAIVSALVALTVTPLWPAYGESIARGDILWVGQTLRRSLTLSTVIAVAGSGLLLIVGRWLLHLWVGPEIAPSTSLLWSLAFFVVVTAVGNAIAMFLNGAGFVAVQLAAGAVMAFVALGLKVVLAPLYGVSGVVWATVGSYLLFTIVPLAIYARHLLTKLANDASSYN